ncbi:MAG: hypothetical protein OEW11_11225 [Nitrospirota bacterium]|nr:hypothetical protein [Nitrospirota bacterium]
MGSRARWAAVAANEQQKAFDEEQKRLAMYSNQGDAATARLAAVLGFAPEDVYGPPPPEPNRDTFFAGIPDAPPIPKWAVGRAGKLAALSGPVPAGSLGGKIGAETDRARAAAEKKYAAAMAEYQARKSEYDTKIAGYRNQPQGSAALTLDPAYRLRQSAGQTALESSAAARGGLLSGAAGVALSKFNQNLVSEEFANAYQRLLERASMGERTANTLVNARSHLADAKSGIYNDLGASQQGKQDFWRDQALSAIKGGVTMAATAINPAAGAASSASMPSGVSTSYNAGSSVPTYTFDPTLLYRQNR